ncbi:UNVERIFIED_CONTAM: putative mitochondrial protein [Sesamum indicum]
MADSTRLKEIQEAQKKTDVMFMDERARRQASEDEIQSHLDQVMDVQEGLHAFVLNVEHSLITVLRRYARYFQMIPIPEDQKVPMASIYMQGKPELWYQGYTKKREFQSWDELVKNILERFEDLDNERVMIEFNKSHHETTLNAYLERFEELKDQMLIFNKSLEEEFLKMKFISGLKEEVKSFVSTCNLTSLNQAMMLARKQEHTVMLYSREPTYQTGICPQNHLLDHKSGILLPGTALKEKGHRYKYKQVYMLLSNGEARDYDESEQGEQTVEEELTVSLNAMKGDDRCTTLKVNGTVGDKEILILIDLGCTHCFIDEKVARALSYELETLRQIGELLSTHKVQAQNDENNRILELLQQFEDVFQEPNSLPPERNIQHCIELLPDAIPKKQLPYRYAYIQKTEIEKIVKEMLENGIVRPSQSSFASPVLLVKKKDGRWNCVLTIAKGGILGTLFLKRVLLPIPQKIDGMLKWPVATSVRAVRGFLRLTGYYRKFIKVYGIISKPFTALLKKDAFEWNFEAELAFNQLKAVDDFCSSASNAKLHQAICSGD